jgi:hypothetical protein
MSAAPVGCAPLRRRLCRLAAKVMILLAASVDGAPNCAYAEGPEGSKLRQFQFAAVQTPQGQSSEPLLDGDDGGRALERILITRGGLVLPKYAAQIEPQLLYFHAGTKSDASQRDILISALVFRLGLPLDAQAELRLPYVIRDEMAIDRVSGVGDAQLALTKQLLRETGRLPSLLISARWTAPTGDDPASAGRAATGTGSHVLEAQATAVKTQDPIAFFATFSYSTPIARRSSEVNVEPGDVAAIKAGGILAASPDTSLGIALTLGFAAAPIARGVPTVDQTIGVVEFSVGQVLSRKFFLDVSVQVGVTRDTPDLGLVVALPIRF